MITIIAVLKIKNVSINLDSTGKLTYILPQKFGSEEFTKFKKMHEVEISAFKNSLQTISENKPNKSTEIMRVFKSVKTEKNDFYCIFTIVSDKRFLHVSYNYTSKKYNSDYLPGITSAFTL